MTFDPRDPRDPKEMNRLFGFSNENDMEDEFDSSKSIIVVQKILEGTQIALEVLINEAKTATDTQERIEAARLLLDFGFSLIMPPMSSDFRDAD